MEADKDSGGTHFWAKLIDDDRSSFELTKFAIQG
jgi:hypothetical protein